MREVDLVIRDAAERALEFLGATDPWPNLAADAIIGFGVFDLSLPRFCGELHQRGVAPRIIFTGGLGAGTGSLGGPEALIWRTELRRSHPDIPETDVILESRSTNTAENIAFTAALLAREHPALVPGHGLRTAILVASPSRMRRVQLTMAQHFPTVRVVRQHPGTNFDRERTLYEANGVDYIAHINGELDRLIDYAARGWIRAEPFPPGIVSAHAVLRSQLRLPPAVAVAPPPPSGQG
jgi:uncharacterized SAM-binding protein YcdF (DUF218 family)